MRVFEPYLAQGLCKIPSFQSLNYGVACESLGIEHRLMKACARFHGKTRQELGRGQFLSARLLNNFEFQRVSSACDLYAVLSCCTDLPGLASNVPDYSCLPYLEEDIAHKTCCSGKRIQAPYLPFYAFGIVRPVYAGFC